MSEQANFDDDSNATSIGVTDVTQKFIDNMAIAELDKSMDQTKALEKAGYDGKYPTQRAYALMQDPSIVEAIEERKRIAAKNANVTPEQILGATAMRAFASIDDAFDEYGNFSIEKARATGAIHLIKKLEKTKHGFRVEFYSNESAQDKLGNYLGMEFAPKENSDVNSLRAGIEQVAKALADENGDSIPNDQHRRLAWEHVKAWALENRAKYSRDAIAELEKEYAGDVIDGSIIEAETEQQSCAQISEDTADT